MNTIAQKMCRSSTRIVTGHPRLTGAVESKLLLAGCKYASGDHNLATMHLGFNNVLGFVVSPKGEMTPYLKHRDEAEFEALGYQSVDGNVVVSANLNEFERQVSHPPVLKAKQAYKPSCWWLGRG